MMGLQNPSYYRLLVWMVWREETFPKRLAHGGAHILWLSEVHHKAFDVAAFLQWMLPMCFLSTARAGRTVGGCCTLDEGCCMLRGKTRT